MEETCPDSEDQGENYNVNDNHDDDERNKKNTSCNLLTIICHRTSLLILVTIYAILGALLFKFLEEDGGIGNDTTRKKHHALSVTVDFQKTREDCLRELWIITERLNVLYEKNWTQLVTEQLRKFERSVVEGAKKDESFQFTSNSKWTFGGSLLYTVTLLTTVGYGRLSPKTTWGKIMAILYAIIGVPLMLILLSELGSILAHVVQKSYFKFICLKKKDNMACSSVGYHKAPLSSPTRYFYNKRMEDSASIQLSNSSTLPNRNPSPNHVTFKMNHINHHFVDHQEIPKRAILATVRSTHSRGRCRGRGFDGVRQILTDPNCPTHRHHHSTSLRNSSIVGISTDIELEDVEESDENDQRFCTQHDTPSRIPLIWRPPDSVETILDDVDVENERLKITSIRRQPHFSSLSSFHSPPSSDSSTPAVPTFLAIFFYFFYVIIGATCFANTITNWTFLDAIYFCFLALSTIGVLPLNFYDGDDDGFHGQLQILACCTYIFIGLVIISMCFNLVHKEVTIKCRQLASSIGLNKE